jgi:hypothetical protein
MHAINKYIIRWCVVEIGIPCFRYRWIISATSSRTSNHILVLTRRLILSSWHDGVDIQVVVTLPLSRGIYRGWESFMHGQWHWSWHQVQHRYLQSIGCQKTGKQWLTMVLLINIPKEWILSRKVLTGLKVNANYRRSNVFANSYLYCECYMQQYAIRWG